LNDIPRIGHNTLDTQLSAVRPSPPLSLSLSLGLSQSRRVLCQTPFRTAHEAKKIPWKWESFSCRAEPTPRQIVTQALAKYTADILCIWPRSGTQSLGSDVGFCVVLLCGTRSLTMMPEIKSPLTAREAKFSWQFHFFSPFAFRWLCHLALAEIYPHSPRDKTIRRI